MRFKPEIPVRVTHNIMVDMCIADEVAKLNNKYGISTEFSCCGHGYRRSGYIKVLESHIEDMKALGYKQKAPKSEPTWFKPKSSCQCRSK